MKKIVLAVIAILASGVSASYAETPKNVKDSTRGSLNAAIVEEQSTLQDARNVYRELIGNHALPQSVHSKANCVVVVPKMVSAALVVGGSHGDAVASCKTGANTWSDPAFIDLTSASLGAQIGGKTTDMVLFITNERAEKSLKSGKFVIGADASVLAGSFDKSWTIPDADAVVYQRASGAFIGASIDGLNMYVDKDSNEKLYGKGVNVSAILDGKNTSSSNADVVAFKDILPNV